VQTTLLGFAIAIILALVAALVGPLFIDWGHYRGEFEARASRVSGLEFHVTGPIGARLLPTPTLTLHGLEFGRPGEASKVRARALRVEFALGSLVRGEWKIADARLEGPEFAIGLDPSGRLAWPVPSVGFEPEGVSIQKLNIEDGRAILADAASGSRLVLDKLEFKGELRSLAGPAKGEGSFVVGGQHYPYRLSVGRLGDDGSARVRLALDPIDRPLTAEIDLSLTIEQGTPRVDGAIALSRSVGRAQGGGIIEPWRLTSRLKGDSAAAVFEQIEFQYGPDERAIKLRGDARLTFGTNPHFDGVLSSPQIDLDRVLALPETARRRPVVALKTFADYFSGHQRLPFPVRLGVTVETLTLAGAALQRVTGDVKSDANGWEIETLDLRAPGISQIGLAGRLGTSSKGVTFNGRAKVDAADPRALLAWLTDRPDAPPMTVGHLRLSGDVALGGEAIAIDWLTAEFERMTVTGRFAYAWANDDRPARLHAALTASELDVDRLQGLAQAIAGDTEFDWPREGTLSLKTEHATFAGVGAKQVDVNVRIDANGLGVERLTVADFGGATLAVKGRIDTQTKSPRGALTLDLDARALDGVAALVEKFSPQIASELRRSAERFAPLGLRASLSVDSNASSAAAGTALARFKIDGRAGTFRIALAGDAEAIDNAFTLERLSALSAANVKLTARLDADDARAFIELAGLDRFVALDKRAGVLTLAASGALKGAIAVDGQLAAGPFNLATKGTLRLSGDASPAVTIELKVANANVRSLRPAAAGKAAEFIPASFGARLDLTDNSVTLTDLAGSVAGMPVAGRLAVGLAQPMRLDGDIEVGTVDLPAVLAAAVGVPVQSASAGALWPSEPFEAGLPYGLTGQVALKSARVSLTPKLTARDARGVLHFGDGEFALQDIDGSVAGGRLSGELSFARRAEALSARGHIKLTSVNAAELIPGDGALSGRLTLDLTAEGAGRSAVALVGSLAGGGTFMLENGRLARLDPKVFDALIRAVDQGLPIDIARVRDWMEKALAANGLAVTTAEGALTLTAGQARLAGTVVRTGTAELAVSGNANLADGSLDARLVLSGPFGMAGVADARPEVIIVLKGPFDAPKRTIDVAALSSWLALRAVEQQSQKLEMLEGRASPANAAPGIAPAEAPAVVPNNAPAIAPNPAPTAASPSTDVAPAHPATSPDAARAEPDALPPKPRPSARPKPKPTEQARPTPPLDLRQFLFGPRS
jgi:uncharacterized protein involved in outer membrane biogenesis